MYYLGVMSGTSCDGVDVVLMDFSNGIETHAVYFLPYPEALQSQLSSLIANQAVSIAEFSEIDAKLAEIFATAINQLLSDIKINPLDVEAIGLHGQTVYHDPIGKYRNTLQIGSAALVAQRTGIVTVANFRQMDVAYGGQGAPLAPVIHKELFYKQQGYKSESCIAVLNLGGIANITVIDDESMIGFDTGPANCLMDEWIKKHKGHTYDKGGEWAQQGVVIPKLLNSVLADPYFGQAFPKSTGKEYFNIKWLIEHMDGLNERAEDIQRTLLQITVESIASGIKQVNKEIAQVIVCGGGVHNSLIMTELSEVLGLPIQSSAVYGIDPDYVEAVLMAWLAKQNMENRPLDLTQITGTNAPLIYGVKHYPKTPKV